MQCFVVDLAHAVIISGIFCLLNFVIKVHHCWDFLKFINLFFHLKKIQLLINCDIHARKDTRSPGPHHECHLQFNYKINSTKQKLRRTKKGVINLWFEFIVWKRIWYQNFHAILNTELCIAQIFKWTTKEKLLNSDQNLCKISYF